MFKLKCNIQKIISFILIFSILTISLIVSTSATTLEDLSYTVEFSSWSSSDVLSYEELDREMTEKESAELLEALENIDYNNYEIIKGDYFEIKRIPLLHGYSIEFISITSAKPNQISRGAVYKENRANIYGSGGQLTAYAQLYATYITTSTSVSVQSSGTYSWVASGTPISWSFSSISTMGTSSTSIQLSVTATATANNPGDPPVVVPYKLSVICYVGE